MLTVSSRYAHPYFSHFSDLYCWNSIDCIFFNAPMWVSCKCFSRSYNYHARISISWHTPARLYYSRMPKTVVLAWLRCASRLDEFALKDGSPFEKPFLSVVHLPFLSNFRTNTFSINFQTGKYSIGPLPSFAALFNQFGRDVIVVVCWSD